MKNISFSFLTLGCRLNQAEEEMLRREVMERGFLVTSPKQSSVVLINTCSVTDMADKKSRRQIKDAKRDNPKAKIVVMGCGAKVAKDHPEVDLIIDNEKKANAIETVISELGLIEGDKQGKASAICHKSVPSRRTRAILKIQDGCNNYCAYCIVPSLRGREVSLSRDVVLTEAKKLSKMGYVEIVLSGVNVGKYKVKELNLAGLISLLLSETKFARIRLSSINPQDITDEILALWRANERLCEHFHLSLQSGSTSVLKRMGRPYTAEDYLSLVEKIYDLLPNAAITTDVIVGFPGETDEEFAETCEFVKKINFAKIHVFRYSRREGTRAAKMVNQVPDAVKKIRSEKLKKIGDGLRKKFQDRFIGRTLSVLFEEVKDGYYYGLTSNYIKVRYRTTDEIKNKVREVKITNEML